jgi:hypothetical protein
MLTFFNVVKENTEIALEGAMEVVPVLADLASVSA